jgi:cytochrome o ubiquinol oxidase subunit I
MIKHLLFGNLSLDVLPLDDPITLFGAGGMLSLGLLIALGSITYLKKWGYIWKEWVCTVDHKKIGIMYVLLAAMMLMRGLIQAVMMRAQQAVAAGTHVGYLPPSHYNQFFSEHGVIMIFFVAMPLIFGIINMVLPLQIGARDVAYPFLNSLSFWLTFFAAMMIMASLLIGHFAETGWLAYPPLSGKAFSPGVGVDYYIWVLQISGVGSLLSGINFIATVFKMRCPGMTFKNMPIFVWASLCAMILVALAFPVLTVTLGLLALDRIFDLHFFTQHAGGNVMMYINLIWAWGHPEVYILILPIFGVFSEIVATFSRKRLFGYNTMVWAIILIAFLSFVVWLHHFFTMGSGANVNAFFGIMTMVIAIPTGVKVFNWLFTMYRGKIKFATPMLWIMAFFTTFAIGGMTGVMMSVPPVDFQTHNSLFLIAHFHNVIIGGVLFGFFAGVAYWFPKIFGFRLDEKRGIYAFWLWIAGFYLAFMPLYVLGLMGVMRRTQHYTNVAFQPYFIVAFIGALLILAGVLCQFWQIVYSIMHREELRDTTGDPWGGRTLEWTTASPAHAYNFAHTPTVSQIDDFWYQKQAWQASGGKPAPAPYQDIHMPKNTMFGFVIGLLSTLFGFAVIWDMWLLGIFSIVGVIACIIIKSFNTETDYYIKAAEVAATESGQTEGGAL